MYQLRRLLPRITRRSNTTMAASTMDSELLANMRARFLDPKTETTMSDLQELVYEHTKWGPEQYKLLVEDLKSYTERRIQHS